MVAAVIAVQFLSLMIERAPLLVEILLVQPSWELVVQTMAFPPLGVQ
jgi:hypothetical protein